MSNKEKEVLVSFISAVVVSIPYMLFVANDYQTKTFAGGEELKYWASAILMIIPIRIAVHIVITILVSIAQGIINNKDVEKDISDERDRVIELRGDRFATTTFTFGVIIALLAVILGGGMATMFAIILFAGFLGEILSIFVKAYFYRRGF